MFTSQPAKHLGPKVRRRSLLSFSGGLVGAVGLDIGSSSVKAVALKRAVHGYKLLGLAAEEVPREADAASRSRAFQKVLALVSHDKGLRIVTALAGPDSVLRVVVLPRMSRGELRAALSFEAEKYIPFKWEEVHLDFVILQDLPAGRMEVLLAAARRTLLEEHLKPLQLAGIKPSAVDLEPLAIANAWQMTHPPGEPELKEGQEAAVLIYLGAQVTHLVFFLHSRFRFSREISMGGEAFTQAIAQGLQVDAKEAERIKCRPTSSDAQVRPFLEPLWERWLTECRATFDFYETHFGQKVAQVFWGGGCARLLGFKAWLEENGGFPIKEWNPAQGLFSEEDFLKREVHPGDFGVAMGLAARELG